MTSIDYSIQLKFLDELNNALTDALKKHGNERVEKLKELRYMQSEVNRAQRVVNARIGAKEEVSKKLSSHDAQSPRSYHENDVEIVQAVY